ncbi:MAG TPA: DUF167 domain-containing protein [Phycisphaeraceae bacterium]
MTDSDMPMAGLSATAEGTAIQLKVVPGASRTRLAGWLGDRLKVQIAQPPEAGKANRAVCELLAKQLGVARADVTLIAGATQPLKTVVIAGLSPQQVAQRLKGK